jgi:hypothetical protein
VSPAGSVALPAGQAQRIVDLPGITGYVLSALQARGQRGDPSVLAHLEELAALLTGGGGASQLISDLEAAQRGLAALLLAGSQQ